MVVRRMHRGLKTFATVLVLLLLYVGTFSYWWLSSPARQVTTKDGRQVRVVEFQFNKVSWYTQIIWIPAFWFMEHVVGYGEPGFAAAYEHSVLLYVRKL